MSNRKTNLSGTGFDGHQKVTFAGKNYDVPMACFKKKDVDGKVTCVICNDEKNYSNSGKSALQAHVSKPTHMNIWLLQRQTMRLELTGEGQVVATSSARNPVNIE